MDERPKARHFRLIQYGTQVGEYTIEHHVGSGSFGRVYKARTRGGDFVAAKFTRTPNPESAVLARLDHVCIPNVVDQFQHDSEYVTVLQLIDGVSLASLLAAVHGLPRDGLRVCDTIRQLNNSKDSADMPATSALARSRERLTDFGIRTVASIASALNHAHSRGICHSDVKPENILIGPDGSAFLIDWSTAAEKNTSSECRGGTLGYMHPGSLIRVAGITDVSAPSNDRITESHDIYSLGVLLYELMVGELPVGPVSEGTSTVAQARELFAKQPQLRETVAKNAAIPATLRTIIGACVSSDVSMNQPSVQYASMRQLEEDLHQFVNKRALLHAAESSATRNDRLSRRFRTPVFAVMAAVFVLLCCYELDRWHVSHRLAVAEQRRRSILLKQPTNHGIEDDLNLVLDAGLFPDNSVLQDRRVHALHGLAAAYLKIHDPKAALPLLQKAVELSPTNGEVQNNLGTACFELQQFESAIEAFDIAVAAFAESSLMNREHAAALSNRGAAKAAIGQREEARRDFLKALETHPDTDSARQHLQLLEQPEGEHVL